MDAYMGLCLRELRTFVGLATLIGNVRGYFTPDGHARLPDPRQ